MTEASHFEFGDYEKKLREASSFVPKVPNMKALQNKEKLEFTLKMMDMAHALQVEGESPLRF